jgi:predicted metal-dependent HD superfamily phosphohydrolase
VARSFDSAGPYDRLIAIYSSQARHRDVERVANAALSHVRTHQQKREFYERTRGEARKQATRLPQAAAKRR